MADLTHKGIKINPELEALSGGQGFIVRIRTEWNLGSNQRGILRDAQREGLIGSIYSGHEDTFADARATMDSKIDQFVTDITNFIDNHNTESS